MQGRMSHMGAIAVALFGVMLIGIGGALRSATHESVELNDTYFDLGSIHVGESVDIVATVHNYSPRRWTVVGATDRCTPEGCVSTVNLPCTIDSGESAEVRITTKPMRDGPFALSHVLYAGSENIIALQMQIVGNAAVTN